MRGGARTGAGRPPKSLRLHQLQGTYRHDRHGRREPPPPALPHDWKPDPDALAVLSPKGRAFIAEALERFEFNFLAGRVLINVAVTLDLITACQQSIDEHGVMLRGPRGKVRINPMVREHRRHTAFITQAMKALKLEG